MSALIGGALHRRMRAFTPASSPFSVAATCLAASSRVRMMATVGLSGWGGAGEVTRPDTAPPLTVIASVSSRAEAGRSKVILPFSGVRVESTTTCPPEG